jgi:hypothetical protein
MIFKLVTADYTILGTFTILNAVSQLLSNLLNNKINKYQITRSE